jgi:hypothetical protein
MKYGTHLIVPPISNAPATDKLGGPEAEGVPAIVQEKCKETINPDMNDADNRDIN